MWWWFITQLSTFFPFSLLVTLVLQEAKTRRGQGGPSQPPSFGTLKISAFFTKSKSRFASDVLDAVMGPLCPPQHTTLCNSRSNAQGAGPWRALCQLKNPLNVQDGDEGFAGRNIGEKCIPDKRSLICPPGKSLIFYLYGPPKYLISCDPPWQGRPLRRRMKGIK